MNLYFKMYIHGYGAYMEHIKIKILQLNVRFKKKLVVFLFVDVHPAFSSEFSMAMKPEKKLHIGLLLKKD